MFRCEQCGKRLSSLKSKIGSDFTCPYCGFSNILEPGKKQNPISPSVEKADAPSHSNQLFHQSEKKKANAFVNYALIGIALLFCLISIVLFKKTLDIKIMEDKGLSGVENLLVDKEAEQALYTPVDIEGEKLGLSTGMDEETSKKLHEAAAISSNKVEESDIQKIHDLFSQFVKETDPSKKSDFVFSGNEMKPLIQKWDAKNKANLIIPGIVSATTHTPPFMLVRFSTGALNYKDVVFIKDSKSGKWQIDWPPLVGYSDYTGKELAQIRPHQSVPIRATISMSNKYEPPFMDTPSSSNHEGKSYLCVNVLCPDGQEFSGFIDRHSDTALEISQKLTSGDAPLIVALRFPEDPEIQNKNTVIIDKIIQDNWLSTQANELTKKIQQ